MGTPNYDWTYLVGTNDIDLVGDTKTFLDEIDATLKSEETRAKAAEESVTGKLPGYVRNFDTVTDMKASTDLSDGMVAHTSGYRSEGDGGAAFYEISTTGTPNDMDVIQCQNSLVATFMYDGKGVTPQQMGAYCDGDTQHDDADYINHAISEYGVVVLTDTTYYARSLIELQAHGVNIVGQGMQKSIIRTYSNAYGIRIGTPTFRVDSCRLENFMMINASGEDIVTGIYVENMVNSRIRNMIVMTYCIGIYFNTTAQGGTRSGQNYLEDLNIYCNDTSSAQGIAIMNDGTISSSFNNIGVGFQGSKGYDGGIGVNVGATALQDMHFTNIDVANGACGMVINGGNSTIGVEDIWVNELVSDAPREAGIKVTNCLIKGDGKIPCVMVNGAWINLYNSSTTKGIVVDNSYCGNFSNVCITQNDTSSAYLPVGIYMHNAINASVENSLIEHMQIGALLEGSMQCDIRDSKFIVSDGSAEDTCRGVFVHTSDSGTNNACSVTGNSFTGSRMINSYYVEAGSSHCVVAMNRSNSCGVGADSGSDGYNAGNLEM